VLKRLAGLFRETAASQGLGRETLVFTRVFLSDVAGQSAELARSDLWSEIGNGAVSLVQQGPLDGSPAAMICYHVRGKLRRTVVPRAEGAWRSTCVVEGAHYSMHWAANYADGRVGDSAGQTTSLLTDYCAGLSAAGLSLHRNTIRTWVYVRDIDTHYQGMVDARREFFARHGLSASTRYVASTGIGGIGPEPGALVSFDAVALKGVTQKQIVRMEAPDHMSPTIAYGVTFERGLRVRFGDRSHLHVSGTASIDAQGKVLHEGDVVGQAGRMLENVQALLDRQGATLRDLTYACVYLRNPSDAARVLDIVRPALPEHVPLVAVHGPVCRPQWLVEMDALAIVPDKAPFAAFL
jgi:enamine deaminase RidA (YjgF/YER057c/UK114 family)